REVDGQGVDLSPMRAPHPQLVGNEAGEAAHIVPDFLVGGVEEMRAVAVDLDAGLAMSLSEGVAGNMRTSVDDEDTKAACGSAFGDGGAIKAGTNNQEVDIVELAHGRAPGAAYAAARRDWQRAGRPARAWRGTAALQWRFPPVR